MKTGKYCCLKYNKIEKLITTQIDNQGLRVNSKIINLYIMYNPFK